MKFSKELAEWVRYSQKYLHTLPDRPEFTSYGNGYNGWGNQTNQKGFAAFAVAAADDAIVWEDYGLTRETVRGQALAMLRFNLESHIEGSYRCADGEKWGHTWISALGTERMMHGVEAIWEFLSEEDRALLRKVLLSEADWLTDRYEVVAGLSAEGNQNRPESNIWNGCALLRCMLYYPDCPRYEEYRAKATKFLVNGISVPSDEFTDDTVDGFAVKELFVGANMYENYACDHHGYMNVGYMVICLSNLAMMYFSYKARNVTPPEALLRHAYDLWKLIRALTFDDGRLFRIGGDTRARYCYCQDYAVPMWLFISDAFGEDCTELLEKWVDQLHTEIAANGDGSFLSERVGYLEEHSLIYYTRLESDRAAVLSMAEYWSEKYGFCGEKHCADIPAWQATHHGGGFVKGKKRYASFIWHAGELPQGMCLPRDASDLAEWRFNLAGLVLGGGALHERSVIRHNSEFYPGGFVTCGLIHVDSLRFITEQQNIDRLAAKHIAFAVLPDDSTVLGLQYATSRNYCLVKSVKSIFWNIPNDIFNHDCREYYFNGDKTVLARNKGEETVLSLGKYVNVDDVLGMASMENLSMYRSPVRQVEIKRYAVSDFTPLNNGSLYCDEIVGECFQTPTWRERGDVLFDTAYAMNVGTAAETQALALSLRAVPDLPAGLRGISAVGADGKRYTLVANFSEESVTYRGITLEPDTAKLF